MDIKPGSIALWVAAAVLLFWAVGAYNRLMRLRAEANAAFAALDEDLTKQVELVRTLPAADATQPAPLDGEPGLWASLHAAAGQCAASLSAVRNRPLNREGISALATARDVLAHAWARAEHDDAHDLAGPRLPQDVLQQRAQLAVQALSAADHFDRSVLRYNAAIRQFPAVILAVLFGFRPGRPLARKDARPA